MPPERRPPRVLVVEDDPHIRDLVATRLELAGLHAFKANDGFEALVGLEAIRPDAMVLDLSMPGMDGLEVLRRMRQSSLIARTPTMVLTARNQPGDVKAAIALGARDFLAKPFRDDQFLARIARLLRRAPAPAGPARPKTVRLD